MNTDPRIDDYIQSLPKWQQAIYADIRQWIHEAAPDIQESIKFSKRPYFVFNGNVCAFLAAKNHANVFIYDPIAPDPHKLINQGQGNATARSIQIQKDRMIDKKAFIELIKAVVSNNRSGGWRKLSQ